MSPTEMVSGVCTVKSCLSWCGGHRLGLPCASRCFEPALRFAAQPCLGQQAPNATAAYLEPLLCQEMLDAACAVGAASLCKIPLHFLLQLLLSSRVGPKRAVPPLVITTA